MIQLDLGRFRRIRVWFEPLEQARFKATKSLMRTVIADSKPDLFEVRCVCVELVAPHGAQVDYGLLGACFVPLPEREDVTIAVSYVEDGFGIGPKYDSRIAVSPENPVVGLPMELADSVATGATGEVTASWPGGPGEIQFSYAAHGAYGSSSRVFSLLAQLVVIVLRSTSMEVQDLERLLVPALSA